MENWRSIIRMTHIDNNGKYLSLTLTMNAIRIQWSTDINIRGIHAYFIPNCINSCMMCRDVKIWDEIITIFQYILNVTIDTLYMKYIILRGQYKPQDERKQLSHYTVAIGVGTKTMLIENPKILSL